MKKVPYYKQKNEKTCSLACLKMALEFLLDKSFSEKQLLGEIEGDYGRDFNLIWNPTITLLAAKYGLSVELYVLWPLLKKGTWEKAYREWKRSPKRFNWELYEPRKGDEAAKHEDRFIQVAYKDIFNTVKLGGRAYYGSLTANRMVKFLNSGKLIILIIVPSALFPKKVKKKDLHSILLFSSAGKNILFHDPYYGENLKATKERIKKAHSKLGAGIVLGGLEHKQASADPPTP